MQRCETFHSRYFYGKRSHFYGKWSVNPLVTLVFMYLTQKVKVRKALNNKFVCVFITCKVYRNWMLIKFTTGMIVPKKIDRDPKVSESPRKIDSVHQKDSSVATRACAVATKIN